MNKALLSDGGVLDVLGERVARRRIDIGMTQAELARQAGIGRATVERLEAGRSTQLSSFVRILRVLGFLADFLAVVPESGLGPMDLLKKNPKQRQRASSRRKSVGPQGEWTWGDES